MRRLLAVLAAMTVLSIGLRARADVCDDIVSFELDTGTCGHYQEGNKTVCACPIVRDSKNCTLPDRRAAMAAYVVRGSIGASTGNGELGTYPVLGSGDSRVTLSMFQRSVDVNADIAVNLDGFSFDNNNLGSTHWDAADVVLSPDGSTFAAGVVDFDSSGVEGFSKLWLFRCSDASMGESGWRIEQMLQLSSRVARWGVAAPNQRVLYLAKQSYFKLTMRREPVFVKSGGNNDIEAIVLESLHQLVRRPDHDDGLWKLPIADNDMTFTDDGITAQERYATFFAENCEGCPKGTFVKNIVLMDLQACKSLPCGLEANDYDFCCKSYLLYRFPGKDHQFDYPTQPSLNREGSLVTFHYDKHSALGSYSYVYVMKNPLMAGLAG